MQREFLRWGAQSLRNVWAKKFNPYRGMTLSVCWCVHVVCDPLLPRSGPFVRALCATHLHDPHPLVPGLQSSFHRGESCGLTTNTKKRRNRDNDGDGVFPSNSVESSAKQWSQQWYTVGSNIFGKLEGLQNGAYSDKNGWGKKLRSVTLPWVWDVHGILLVKASYDRLHPFHG